MDDIRLKEKLNERYNEEIADYNFYNSFAKEFEQMGYNSCANLIKCIAREEKQHSVLIHHIIDKLNN